MKILAFSGRKQSGKNTCFNLLLGLEMLKLAVVRDKIAIQDDGRLWISDIFGDPEYQGIFDPNRKNETMKAFLAEYIHPFIKNYSFADALKDNICIDILGLTPEMCYGTDDDKNQPTHLKWENMPGVFTGSDELYLDYEGLNFVRHKPGTMTAREVMQFFGTEIFREAYPDVWVDSCIRRIQYEQPELAVITDCRFPNEVDGVHKAGGKVVRLTRGANSCDVHESELVLDKNNYDWNNFDAILDNANMTIGEQNKALIELLSSWGWLDDVKEEQLVEQE